MLIEEIKKTIDEMTDEELMEALTDIRHNRTKETVILTKARAKKDSSDKLLGSLTPEMAAMLLKQMLFTLEWTKYFTSEMTNVRDVQD